MASPDPRKAFQSCRLINEIDYQVIGLNCLDSPCNLAALDPLSTNSRSNFERVNILDAYAMRRLFLRSQPGFMTPLTAESYIDRSIEAPARFVQTNTSGTFSLRRLQVMRDDRALFS